MSLSCSCECGVDWSYFGPEDFSKLATKRSRKCCSCRAIIRPGASVGLFQRVREPSNDIEERIHGDEVYMSDWYMCEECVGLYFSLTDLGFCINLGEEKMRDLAKEYAATYGPKK